MKDSIAEGDNEADAEPALGADFGWSPEMIDGYQAKAGAFRGLAHAVSEAGLRERVLVGLPAATRKAFDKPPLSVAFMPGVHFQYVLRELDAIGGDELVRRIARESIMLGPANMMRPLVEGTLRLFGATPHAFFRKLPAIMNSQIRGMSFEYDQLGPGEATMLVRFDTLSNIPARTWWYWEGVFSSSYDLCKVEGTSRAEPLDSPANNAALVRCTWSGTDA